MTVAVIIVNYGTAALAADAVDSVLSVHDASTEIEVHLVDNASPGEDARHLTEHAEKHGWGDRVRLWLETRNHGFGEGNNIVLRALADRQAPPDYVFLLNPDATMENDAVAYLTAALDADPKVAAAGAAIRGADGEPAVAAFRFPGFVSEVTRVIDFGPLARLFKGRRVALGAVLPHGAVDWVSGAAVMFRFRALEEIGFFDPGFFLYYEEVDLMRRLRAAGWRVLHVPEAQVMHHAGIATGVGGQDDANRRNPPYLYRSWALYFSKSFGRGKALLLALALFPAGGLNVLQSRLRGRSPSLPQKFFRDHWSLVVRPLIGKRNAP
ncbi:MAG: glycosyltransferase family 2 protein [Silicimonas sp.]|nr:glycosyltransferase family 2 protein [Silicimonas sp.]